MHACILLSGQSSLVQSSPVVVVYKYVLCSMTKSSSSFWLGFSDLTAPLTDRSTDRGGTSRRHDV